MISNSNPVISRTKLFYASAFLAFILVTSSCSQGSKDSNASNDGASASSLFDNSEEDAMIKEGKGIGPVKNIELGAVDEAMANSGKAIFDAKCTACHNFSADKKVGPGLLGVTERRKPEWIANQILNPAEMTKYDPTAKDLLATYLTQMTNQNVTEEQARSIIEYFRQQDALAKK